MILSTDNPKINQYKENDIDVFDFGVIAKNTDALLTVKVSGNNLTNISVKSTCNCTAAGVRYLDSNNAEFQVKYKNTNLSRPFAVVLTYSANENGAPTNGKIKIKGNII